MKQKIKTYGFLIFLLLLLSEWAMAQSKVLYSDDFTDAAIWAKASGVETEKNAVTPYGTVRYYNISIYPTTLKTYKSIPQTGYLDFRKGSSSITTANSYIEFPTFTFVNGGTFTITYGAGSTSKKLQLQEWTGTEWSSASYASVTTTTSSTWYNYTWTIEGSGEKTLRLVLVSSSAIYLASVEVLTYQPEVSVLSDTIQFGRVGVSETPVAQLDVSFSNIVSASSAILASTYSANFTLSSLANSASYSTIDVPLSGGELYIHFTPTGIGTYSDSIVIYSAALLESKTIYLFAEVTDLSSEAQLLSIRVDDVQGVISEEDKTITFHFLSDQTFPITDAPEMELSDYASAEMVGSIALDYALGETAALLVTAEDGTAAVYTFIVYQDADATAVPLKDGIYPYAFSVNGGVVLKNFPHHTPIYIYNESAHLVYSGKVFSNIENVTLPRGFYFVRAENGFCKKIIVP